MKFTVTFKTPDAIEYALEKEFPGYNYDKDGNRIKETEEEKFDRQDKIKELKEFTSQWVKYGEVITVEFDTEAGTCKVLQ